MEFYKNRQYKELEGETFKDINGYEGKYQVSNYGRVRSLSRYRDNNKNNAYQKGIIFKQSTGKKGYIHVTLYKNGKYKRRLVHRLVAQTFINNEYNLPTVNHKDENKTNNTINNLEWCTQQYNNTYGHRIEKMVEKKAVEIVQIDVNDNYIKVWKNIEDVGRKLKISGSVIVGCCNGNYKTACGYKWMYKTEYDKINKSKAIKYKFRNKPFVQLTLNGEYIREWYSLMEMHKDLGFGISCISNCLNKHILTSNGYKWIYLSEYYEKFNDEDKEYSNTLGHEYLMNFASKRKIM